MALGYYFSPKSFSTEQYDETTRRLEAAGQGSPAGRICHCAFEGEGGIHVFDVWNSEEEFAAFGQTLMPILADVGVDPGEPNVAKVHNMIVA